MPSFDIIRESAPETSFRVASVIGKFDLQGNQVNERFTGAFEFPDGWQIGLIVGNSGTGKTTIAKELFDEAFVCGFDYDKPTILDDMPKQLSVDEITRMFNSVGFSSPPSWLKPYRVLSNGEKMRVDLARALLSDLDLIVFDEFTSVVDRDVAKIGSFAVQKAVRRTDKKFIAVTCHFDVEDWLQPDWVFDTNTMQLRIDKKKSQKSELTYTSAKTKQYGRHLKSIII
jgi:ABC-type dipeptide/oligopeptide/nickel transport system ATPase subunit